MGIFLNNYFIYKFNYASDDNGNKPKTLIIAKCVNQAMSIQNEADT